ncbi:hypothetical protein F5884DRAFT_666856, partial [Xylogone sp. PMI_703]
HLYCRTCIRMLFEQSMTDESIFPPRCCREPITISSVQRFLTKDIKRRYNRKRIEFRTRNRTYCHSRKCAAFIRPSRVEVAVATCKSCGLKTCTFCKAKGHKGDCAPDPHLKKVLDLAKTMNWQRCPSCKAVVERIDGCRHISCRCGAHFCYQCGRRYGIKRCSCY